MWTQKPFRNEFVFAFVGQEFEVGERGFASEFAVIVTKFVFQNPAKPAAHGGLAGEAIAGAHRGQKRFLHQVLGHFRFAHPRQRITIEDIAMFIDPKRGVVGIFARGCGRGD